MSEEENKYTPSDEEEARFGTAIAAVQEKSNSLASGEKLRDTVAFKQMIAEADAMVLNAEAAGISVPQYDDQTGRKFKNNLERLSSII